MDTKHGPGATSWRIGVAYRLRWEYPKAVMERAVETGLIANLGYCRRDPLRRRIGHRRNGDGSKMVLTHPEARWKWRCPGAATATSHRSCSRSAKFGCRGPTSK